MADNIFVICAHNDDQIIGCGGTIAKYAKEGKKVHTFIFSHGELSHPWLKPEVVKNIRSKELLESNRILGGYSVKVYGLWEGKFEKEALQKKVPNDLAKAIKEIKPSKILTHSPDDPHPDHKATLKIVEELLEKHKLNTEVYTFSVWNPIRTKKRLSPRLIVDTSETFGGKIKAFKSHKSQRMTMLMLMWNVFAKDIFNGIKTGHRFAEVFFKLR